MSDTIDLDAAYRQHAPRIRLFLLRHVGDDSLADDLLSQVFESACRAGVHYQDRGFPVSSWLYRIAKNRLIDYGRAERRRAHVVPTLRCLRCDDGGIERAIDRAAAAPLIAALARIPERYARVVRLRFLEDRSLTEVAAMLGLPAGAVKSLQHRALAALRRQLDP